MAHFVRKQNVRNNFSSGYKFVFFLHLSTTFCVSFPRLYNTTGSNGRNPLHLKTALLDFILLSKEFTFRCSRQGFFAMNQKIIKKYLRIVSFICTEVQTNLLYTWVVCLPPYSKSYNHHEKQHLPKNFKLKTWQTRIACWQSWTARNINSCSQHDQSQLRGKSKMISLIWPFLGNNLSDCFPVIIWFCLWERMHSVSSQVA